MPETGCSPSGSLKRSQFINGHGREKSLPGSQGKNCKFTILLRSSSALNSGISAYTRRKEFYLTGSMIRANSKALEDLMKRQLFRGVFRHHYTHISFAAIAYCRQSVIADGGFTVPVWFDFQTPPATLFSISAKNISLIICVRIPP